MPIFQTGCPSDENTSDYEETHPKEIAMEHRLHTIEYVRENDKDCREEVYDGGYMGEHEEHMQVVHRESGYSSTSTSSSTCWRQSDEERSSSPQDQVTWWRFLLQ